MNYNSNQLGALVHDIRADMGSAAIWYVDIGSDVPN